MTNVKARYQGDYTDVIGANCYAAGSLSVDCSAISIDSEGGYDLAYW